MARRIAQSHKLSAREFIRYYVADEVELPFPLLQLGNWNEFIHLRPSVWDICSCVVATFFEGLFRNDQDICKKSWPCGADVYLTLLDECRSILHPYLPLNNQFTIKDVAKQQQSWVSKVLAKRLGLGPNTTILDTSVAWRSMTADAIHAEQTESEKGARNTGLFISWYCVHEGMIQVSENELSKRAFTPHSHLIKGYTDVSVFCRSCPVCPLSYTHLFAGTSLNYVPSWPLARPEALLRDLRDIMVPQAARMYTQIVTPYANTPEIVLYTHHAFRLGTLMLACRSNLLFASVDDVLRQLRHAGWTVKRIDRVPSTCCAEFWKELYRQWKSCEDVVRQVYGSELYRRFELYLLWTARLMDNGTLAVWNIFCE
ncbi:hypothetical protein BZG36_00546 [Bifiguratus adelaidae]|uniref:Uncharacterized protein n=1 Tax=Bifiguratus adelaidae TaxID=1938954 RepID=A0A261Y717_9FUNG|nr:hypothetical protein BZG36_00546 [Bifiguratus adelaidae]